jgi:hypothetical protein
MGVFDKMANTGYNPIAGAIDTYTALTGIESEKRKQDRLDAAEGRAVGAEGRAIERHEQTIAAGETAATATAEDRAYLLERRGEEKKVRKLTGIQARLDADVATPEDLAFLSNNAVGTINFHKNEMPGTVMQAHANVGKFADQLEGMQAQGPVSIQRSAKNEEVFQSLERLSADRGGAVSMYSTSDAEGNLTEREGTVGQIVSVLYDPQANTMSVAMSVVDPETGEQLNGPDGSPLVVPATQGRSADPNDPIIVKSLDDVRKEAKLGIDANDKVIKNFSRMSPLEKRVTILSARLEAGDKTAAAELKETRSAQSLMIAYKELLADTKNPLDEQERLAVTKVVSLLEQGLPVAEANAVGNVAASSAVRKATELAAKKTRQAKTTEAIKVEKAKGVEARKLQEMKGKSALAVAALKETDSGMKDVPESVRRAVNALDKAKDRLVRERGVLEKKYHDLNGDPVKRAALQKDDGTFKTIEEFLAESPNIQAATSEISEHEQAIRDAGYHPTSMNKLPPPELPRRVSPERVRAGVKQGVAISDALIPSHAGSAVPVDMTNRKPLSAFNL